jgi:hypothetical protein
MTAQIAENLYFEGQKLPMCANPLSDYFFLSGVKRAFESNCTALWRGYVGTWEIRNNRLYLIALHGTLMDGSEANLATFFPDFPDRVFAHWYTGTLRVPQGKQLEYVHMGYASVHERDLFIEIEKGIVQTTKTIINGESDNDDAPQEYGVTAMTVFADQAQTDKGSP